MTPIEKADHAEAMLAQAVQALAALGRDPQERIDRALSYFARGWSDEPPGRAGELWRRVYAILGDPPIGTPIVCRLETLSDDERAELPQVLCQLWGEATRALIEAERAAGG